MRGRRKLKNDVIICGKRIPKDYLFHSYGKYKWWGFIFSSNKLYICMVTRQACISQKDGYCANCPVLCFKRNKYAFKLYMIPPRCNKCNERFRCLTGEFGVK